MTVPLLLTFNAGSSSVKFGIFAIDGSIATRLGKGLIDFRADPLSFHLTEGPMEFDQPMKAGAGDDLKAVIEEAFLMLSDHFDMTKVVAAGHRVVHGGDDFAEACLLDDATIAAIEALVPLAPLHQPQALRFIKAIRAIKPELVQTASFDTAFHATQSDLVRRFALPRALHDQGIKRYGFHGLSYAYIAHALRSRAAPIARGKVVAAHLGSGASVCAFDNGVSTDTSMGFSTLDGIPMATRPGWLDPGVVLHLLGPGGQSLSSVEDLLYHRSGLLGISGISADIRDLAEDGGVEAETAIEVFTFRIAGEIGRLAVSLGGLDAIVFTAGIGEHSPDVRRRILERLSWMGFTIDADANGKNAFTITTAESRLSAHVIPTEEEQIIADEALAVTAGVLTAGV